MKKVLAYAAPLALAFSFNMALPTAANADPGGGGNATNQTCKNLVPWLNGIFNGTLTHGNCMSFFNAGKPNANAICNLFFPAVPNGDCISAVNEFLNS